jgi:uncharacterized protein
MEALNPLAASENATIVLGVNTDDLTEYRPGQLAATEAGARFPLVSAGFSKGEVREASRVLGLRTWDKPAAACLASRIPTGTAVSVELLSTVEELASAIARRDEIVRALRQLGFRYVTIDLEGFRSGSTA